MEHLENKRRVKTHEVLEQHREKKLYVKHDKDARKVALNKMKK